MFTNLMGNDRVAMDVGQRRDTTKPVLFIIDEIDQTSSEPWDHTRPNEEQVHRCMTLTIMIADNPYIVVSNSQGRF